MRVVGLPEFQRCVQQAVHTSRDETDLQAFFEKLGSRHEAAEMRVDLIRIEGTQIRLWATETIKLTSGQYRVTWRYEDRDGEEVVVCFTLAEF